MKDKQRLKEVTLRLTPEEFQAFDSARSRSGLKFQTILYGFMTAFLSGAAVPKTEQIVKSPSFDSQTAAETDTDISQLVYLVKEMRLEIGELARRVEANARGGEAPGVGADAPSPARVPVHTRPKR